LFYQIKEEKRVVNVYCSLTVQHEGMLLYHKCGMYYAVFIYRISCIKQKPVSYGKYIHFLVIPLALKVPINQNMNLSREAGGQGLGVISV
jgi:hypothetical protein